MATGGLQNSSAWAVMSREPTLRCSEATIPLPTGGALVPHIASRRQTSCRTVENTQAIAAHESPKKKALRSEKLRDYRG
jgi:hypothetical protein